ncbi:AmmeMemoRadiSam system protein A [Marinobacter lacisalsi]|uniref:AmmeMemoRadiSam system protein A n=1 Tax=Marinobacter lacisalsi TaxID=475979 RepID=A0ABV8QND6_9GAMM
MLSGIERSQLLGLADASIGEGLVTGTPLQVELQNVTPHLASPGTTFVTLRLQGQLRGCIGSLEALRPLAEDCAANAFAAAFRDPRFAPVTAAEYPLLQLHISVLEPPRPLSVGSEAELLDRLRPGEDGLVLVEGGRRATFLPSVWEQLPDPGEFVRHLKRKAGLPGDYWSTTLQFGRYGVEEFDAASGGTAA